MFELISSVARSMRRAAAEDPEVKRFAARHRRFFQFIRRRLTPDEKFGLYLTSGSVLTFFFVYLFVGVVRDLIGRKTLYRADSRLINLLQIFRTPAFDRVMLFVTYLGQWPVVLAGLAGLALVLLVSRRRRVLAAVLISVGGGELFVWLAEALLRRPGPPLLNALAPARGSSFPSGHSFLAVSFYGLLTYFAVRSVRGRWRQAAVAAAGALLVLAIGFSRIYLGVHWPSDVLASYAAGAAWLTALVTVMEIRRRFGRTAEPGRGWKRPALAALGGVVFLSWSFFAVCYYWTHPLPTPAVISPEEQPIAAADIPSGLFADLPPRSESLTGAPIEPVNVVIIGTPEQLDRAFRAAGWLPADPFTPRTIWEMIVASVLDRPYPQGPGVPSFWNGRPNDLAYEQTTARRTIRQRHHVHLWYTPLVTANGDRVWFGTAHYDQGIKLKTAFIVPTHSIDPALDKERDKIRADLSATGLVASTADVRAVDPLMSVNPAGDYYFTDGLAAVIILRDPS